MRIAIAAICLCVATGALAQQTPRADPEQGHAEFHWPHGHSGEAGTPAAARAHRADQYDIRRRAGQSAGADAPGMQAAPGGSLKTIVDEKK